MSSRIDYKIKCPYYHGVVKSKRMIGIECDALMSEQKLGFDVTHYQRLRTYRELNDYVDIFCCDQWETCPYAATLIERS